MLSLLLIGLAVSAIVFAITWAISVKVNNYGFVDVAFSYGVAIIAPIYAVAGPGLPLRKWLSVGIAAAWSLRLGTYLLFRVLHHHPKEDVRYETLRKRWPGPGMFLAFFELQAVVVVIFSVPFLLAAFNTVPTLQPIEIAGLALAFLSLCGEALADRQMKAFKADPANKDKVCQAGLWSYSRHPNYFFEAMIWVSFAIFAFGSPHGWVAIACPLLMLYFLLKVTGIPLTEEHSVRSKGDAYREYQRTTSAFIPWFRKG
jgi:steroid 5-alpha reductase family enzyme